MGRKAKCKYCGKSIDTDNAFKVIVGKTNRYYCDENEYNIIPTNQRWYIQSDLWYFWT